MKEKIKSIIQFVLNPRLLLCVAIGWIITNGWSYAMLGMGTFFKINWMIAVSSAYLAILWFPFSPEKLVTITIALALLHWLFPNDKKTLAVLRDMRIKAMEAVKGRRAKREAKKATEKQKSK